MYRLTLKELDFYSDSLYTRIIKFELPIKNYEPEKIYTILKIEGKQPGRG